MKKLKYSYEKVLKTFEEKEYELLTKEENYIGVTQKLQYICQKHKDKGSLEITYSKLINGHGCIYCGRERTMSAIKKPFNYKEAIELCKKNNFEFIDIKRENSVIYIYFICNKHRDLGVQKMRKTNMKRGIKGCKYCKGDLPEWYVMEKLEKEHPRIKLIGDYKNMSTILECHCLKHNVYWNTSIQKIFDGHGCLECGKEKLSKQRMLSDDEFKEMIKHVNPDIEIISDYKGLESDITVRCKKCGYIWTLNANSLKINGTRCKKCSYTYKGEDSIIEVLDKLKCNYIHQYKFEDCKDVRPLPFDFYLPNYNLCIEFDGQQHYEPRFGEENFKSTKKHDEIKNQYCISKNIDLLRIPYWDSNNIENIIKNKIAS